MAVPCIGTAFLIYGEHMKKNYKRFTKKDIEAIGGLISPDERFVPVKAQPGWFISNHARLASKRRNGTAVLIRTFFINGYETVVTYSTLSGSRKPKMFMIHNLVATAFVNLTYLPKTIHKTVDAVREIGVCRRGLYEDMDFVSAAFSMGIDPYALADVLRQEPDAIEDDYKYYDCLINYGGKPVDLEFRIIRGKYKRG